MRVTQRSRERGAALAVTLIAITALLGLGALTVLSVQTELSSVGISRFSQSALYAAESGATAGIDYLRTHCDSSTSMFSSSIVAGNINPPLIPDILGNNIHPGDTGNPFDPASQLWYQVWVLNNPDDPGLAAGIDNDSTVILRSRGYGPDNTVASVEVTVQNNTCLANFCEHEYAQRNVTSRNDANAACSARVTSGTLRTFTP